MLEINNLYVSYEKRDILKNISFSLAKGETLSIIGPSGCGKSTLLLSIADLKNNKSGNILNLSILVSYYKVMVFFLGRQLKKIYN